MRLDIALSKTELGRRRLAEPPVPGQRGRRSVLIMMDGRKTLLDLLPAIRAVGLSLHDVQAMVDEGLLEVAALPPPLPDLPEAVPEPAPRERRFFVDVAPPADMQDDASVGGDTVPMPRPEPPRGPAPVEKWLHVARLFAMDLLTHMVGRADTELHEQLQRVHAGPAMMAWIEEATLFIAAAAGPERADRFQAQVSAFVPVALRGGAAPLPARLGDLVPGRLRGEGASRRKRRPPQPTTGPGALLEED